MGGSDGHATVHHVGIARGEDGFVGSEEGDDGRDFVRLRQTPHGLAIDEVLPEVDAVMMLRVQSERMQNSFFPSTREYSRLFGLNLDRMNLLQKGALILHPGPMNRGLEISAECADGVQSVILEQVANGVSVRMAVLYLLLGGNIGVGS